MKKKLPIFLITLLMALTAAPVLADAESERANLARLVGELDHLSQSIQRYRIDAAHGRYVFNYEALSNDIKAMRKGITEYISKDLSLAREISPLIGQYVQQRKP